jgi:hypothetical protein
MRKEVMRRCSHTHMRSSVLIATVLQAVLIILLGLPAMHEFSAREQSGAESDIVLANGRVMDPESNLDAVRHIGIRAGKIASTDETTTMEGA